MSTPMKYFSNSQPRTFWRPALLAVLMVVGAPTVMAEESGKAVEDGAKATENDAKKNSAKKDTKQPDGSKPADEKKP